MNRSDYSDDLDHWAMVRWRGAVKQAIEGRRGQAFLRELRDALDALPQKLLISGALADGDQVCAVGSVMKRRGLEPERIDDYDYDTIAEKLGIAQALVREIEFVNDEFSGYHTRTDTADDRAESRWLAVRQWVEDHIHTSGDGDA